MGSNDRFASSYQSRNKSNGSGFPESCPMLFPPFPPDSRSVRPRAKEEIAPPGGLGTPLHKYGNVFVRASRGPGAAGGSYEQPMERGGNCVERNGSERSQVASVANRKPPARPGHREEKRLRASP